MLPERLSENHKPRSKVHISLYFVEQKLRGKEIVSRWNCPSLYKQNIHNFKIKRNCRLSCSCRAFNFKFFGNVLRLFYGSWSFVCRATYCIHKGIWVRWTRRKTWESIPSGEGSRPIIWCSICQHGKRTQELRNSKYFLKPCKTFINFWARACVMSLWYMFAKTYRSPIQHWCRTAAMFRRKMICPAWNMARRSTRAYAFWQQRMIFMSLKFDQHKSLTK